MKRFIPNLLLAVPLVLTSGAHAEVVLHGSGTQLEGNIQITPDMGDTHGGNLFHSFDVFNVLTGESVVFSGPDSVHNVVSRVTGGTSDITGLKSSIIDGPVTVDIPGANFYFINPNGVIFAENGSINATGSIYLGTADVVKLADGGSFYADPAQSSVLTAADPVAFGFLSENPAPITLNGPWLGDPYSPSPVPPGKTFALVGGDIEIRDGAYGGTYIIAPGTNVSLASVASAGDALLGEGAIDVSGFSALGQIGLSGGSIVWVGDPGFDVNGSPVPFVNNGETGSIYIRGGQLTLSGSYLVAQTGGDTGEAGDAVVDVSVRGDMIVETDTALDYISEIWTGSYGGLGVGPKVNLDVGGALRISNGSFVISESYGPGAAGDIDIHASDIEIQGQGLGELTGIEGDNWDIAAGPSVTISVEGFRVLNGGFVGTKNYGPGVGGDLTINANRILATGTGGLTPSLSTETEGGHAGDLSLVTRNLELSDGARIDSSTAGSGAAGDMNITAEEKISISGEFSGIFSQTNAPDAGDAGDLNVTTRLLLLDGGVIDSTTVGDGNAGAVDVHVGDLQLTNGGQIRSFSGGFDELNGGALVVGNGAAGSVTVTATGSVTATGTTASGFPSGLLAETRGAGQGGEVTVTAHDLTLSDGATISSSSLGDGEAGNVTVELGDRLTLNGGSIQTQAVTSDGGNINISVPRLINLVDGQITTSVESGVGQGGNISIDPEFLLLQNSQIIANAYGGPGGNINIVAGQLIADPTTDISASSALGIDGTVNIDAPDSDLSADLAVLPAAYLDASRLMQPGCGAARAGLSSLVERGRGGLPADPDDYLPSLALDPAVLSEGAGAAQPNPSARATPDFAATLRIASAASAECWR